MMRRHFVLVAAFRPFGGRTRNESGESLKVFRHLGVASVRTLLLPVSWSRAFPLLRPSLEDPRLAAVVLFGEAGKRPCVTVERWGRNQSSPIRDEDGALPASRRLDPRGASRRRATWKPSEVVRIIRGAGVPAIESRDAGGFLCNAVYFRTLDLLSRRGDRVPAVFVHLPIPGGGAAPGILPMHLNRALAVVAIGADMRFVRATPARPKRARP